MKAFGKHHLLIRHGTAAAQGMFRVRYVLASKLVNEPSRPPTRYGRVERLRVRR